MNFLELAKQQEEYVIGLRRFFHEHPELADREETTVSRICEELEKANISYVNVPHGGVFAFLGDAKKGRTVLLRADIDALPGQESTVNGGGKPKVSVSKTDGVSHTCGHDCHAAMLLGAAKVLKSIEEQIEGRVICMFERGEEGGKGNLYYLLKYAFDHKLQVDASFGMHMSSGKPTGTVIMSRGNAAAGSMNFDVKIIGKTAHGSAPSAGSSPIDCFVSMYNTFQTMRMKYANPFDPMVFSVGQVHSGYVGNIIPAELTFDGSFRVFNFEDAMVVREQLKKAIENTAEMYNCKVQYGVGVPSAILYNDPECADFAARIYSDLLGSDAVIKAHPMMGSETHGTTSQIWPGVYVSIGCRNEEKGMTAGHHHECFEPDEAALKIGVACYADYAMEFLKSGPDTSDRVYRGTFQEFFAKFNPSVLQLFESEK